MRWRIIMSHINDRHAVRVVHQPSKNAQTVFGKVWSVIPRSPAAPSFLAAAAMTVTGCNGGAVAAATVGGLFVAGGAVALLHKIVELKREVSDLKAQSVSANNPPQPLLKEIERAKRDFAEYLRDKSPLLEPDALLDAAALYHE